MRIASPIVLSEEERAVLSTWTRGRSFPWRLIQRAQIVVMAAQGIPIRDIAQALEVSRPTVQLWRERFLALRLEGLKKDAPRPGRIPSPPEKKVRAVVQATLHTTPEAPLTGASAPWPRRRASAGWRFSVFGIATG